MTDIYLGLALIAAVSLALFLGSARLVRAWPNWACDLAALGIVVVMLLYIQFAWYGVWLVDWLPFSNLIVIGNWLPLFGAVLAAFVWQRLRDDGGRRRLVVGALAATAVYASVHPLLGHTPECQDQWTKDGVCLQSTRYTCTAAAAATLLKTHGIDATERELADLCLTRDGTTWLGLYRGLKQKTRGTEWDVRVVSGSIDELGQLERPAILRVGLETDSSVDSTYQTEYGWIPGVAHSVVLTGLDREFAYVADPTPEIGRERWTREELGILWQGQAMCLVARR
ncbi:MAG: cysteine peptidase family C39 domain-containing protein [Pirellulaceae bacterium]